MDECMNECGMNGWMHEKNERTNELIKE